MLSNTEFVNKLKKIATNYKTLYVMGCFGAPLNEKNRDRYSKNNSYNRKPERQKMVLAADGDTFGFDCVCLIKGVLWGWCGDKSKTYGGAKYASNGVPDITADSMFNKCSNKSADFSKIEVGSAVWTNGHIGVYIGDGLAVECTPKWKNCVQITAVGNIGKKDGYDVRQWKKHGRLPYIRYVKKVALRSTNDIAKEVILGKWGNGAERRKRLTAAGYNYVAIQRQVNKLLQ